MIENAGARGYTVRRLPRNGILQLLVFGNFTDPPKMSPSGFLSRCSSPCQPQDYGFSFCAFAGSFAPEAGWISRGFGFVVSSREKYIEENREVRRGSFAFGIARILKNLLEEIFYYEIVKIVISMNCLTEYRSET
jgi:hypothetical protein